MVLCWRQILRIMGNGAGRLDTAGILRTLFLLSRCFSFFCFYLSFFLLCFYEG